MANKTPDIAAAIVDQIAAELDHLTNAELLELGHASVTMVVARTKKGLDADRAPFKAYSPEYAKTRQEEGLQSNPPDLAVTGHMLGSMIPTVTGKDEVTVGFMGGFDAKKAMWHNEGVDKTVAVSSHNRDEYTRSVARYNAKKIKKAIAGYTQAIARANSKSERRYAALGLQRSRKLLSKIESSERIRTSRKSQHVTSASVVEHQRHINIPKREFLDIRTSEEIKALGEMIGKSITLRVEKIVKKS